MILLKAEQTDENTGETEFVMVRNKKHFILRN